MATSWYPRSGNSLGVLGEVRDATALAEGVSSGRLKAADLVREALARIDELDPRLHCFLHVAAEEALARAEQIDESVAEGAARGRLLGVPVAVKDNICVRGSPTTCGSRILEGWRPPYTATAVERMEAEGAIVVGKTNLDEFAMGSSTEYSAFGPTLNPLDLSRVPGGSSGGSAAAVAAAMVPLALGSDTGGSVRQPAAFCGVVGVKPTYGLVSRYGLVAFASSLDQIGPLARTVRDAALLLEVIAGHDPKDSTSLPRPSLHIFSELEEGVEQTVVAVVKELTDGCDPPVREGFYKAMEALERSGAKVVEASLPVLEYALPAYYLIAPAEASSNLARFDGVRYGLRVPGTTAGEMMASTRSQGFGKEVRRRILLGTFALSAGYYDAYYGNAQKVRTLIRKEMEEALSSADVLACPTSPCEPFELGERLKDPLTMYLADLCTIPASLAGMPAISVPFKVEGAAFPVGVQFMARPLEDGKAIRVGAALERARDGH
jgi:aspartyl-tRNA(Asn)/glutamyl-tRNA(Gln) amidotransferase subunit A